MKKFLIIAFLGIISFVAPSFLTASPPIQYGDCFVNFVGCMNDAELEYYSTVAVIQDSEKLAARNYVSDVRGCVETYQGCHQE